MAQRYFGHIKWYDPTKRYGFIIVADGSEYFVHLSKLKDQESLYIEGAKVSFFKTQTQKGISAVDVQIETNESSQGGESES